MTMLPRLLLLSCAVKSFVAIEAQQLLCDEPKCLTDARTICTPSSITPCPPCWSRHGEQVSCGPAVFSNGASVATCPRGTTRCRTIAFASPFVRTSRRRRLADATTITPPSSQTTSTPASTSTTTTGSTTMPAAAESSMTVWYTLACVGLCCLVVLLYGVLRYINRAQSREDKRDRDELAIYQAGNPTDKVAGASMLAMSQPPPDTLSLHNPPMHNQSAAHPHESAMQSMFHTVGRISLTVRGPAPVDEDRVLPTAPAAAPAASTRDSAASIVIMEDSGDMWDVDGDDDEYSSSNESK